MIWIQEFMEEIISLFENDSDLEADGRRASCFFTGHRKIKGDKTAVFTALKKNISYLYSLGVREFHAGGALGFDTAAAVTVIDLKRFHPDMKLILNLPYHNQTDKWSAAEIAKYEYAKKHADGIVYTFDGEVDNKSDSRTYLLKRNRDMVNCSAYGIAYFSGEEKSGTGYTLRYAKEKNCEIINIYE